MSKTKTHVKKGQEVRVISGVHKGATGKVLQVRPVKGHVLIEGVRMIKRHLRKSAEHPNGTIAEREGPIHISNVQLVEHAPKAEKPKKKSGKETSSPKTQKAAA